MNSYSYTFAAMVSMAAFSLGILFGNVFPFKDHFRTGTAAQVTTHLKQDLYKYDSIVDLINKNP